MKQIVGGTPVGWTQLVRILQLGALWFVGWAERAPVAVYAIFVAAMVLTIAGLLAHWRQFHNLTAVAQVGVPLLVMIAIGVGVVRRK